jgi:hypothetical protein
MMRPTAARILSASAATAAAGLLAACGGGGGSGVVTKSDYLRKGNAVCRDQAQAIRRLRTPTLNLATARRREVRGLAPYFDQAVPIVRTHLQQLQQLGQPPQDRALLIKVLVRARELLDLLQAIDRQAHTGDVAAFRADLRSAGQASNAGHTLALQYGLIACAQG